MKLKGCVVMITGGAQRVGRVIALNLAAQGAHLVVHFNKSLKAARSLQNLIQKKGGSVHLIQGDLSNLSQLKKVAREGWKARGRLDVLINNASTFYPTPLGKVREKDWEDLFNINARAPFFLSEAIGLKMKARGRGKIINIADWAAQRPYTGYIPYCASKAALIALSQGMAKSLAPEVQVNTVLPGPVLWKDQPINLRKKILKETPLARSGSPEDIASAVRFFIEGNDFMTGAMLHVDGGRHL